jgi:hypothetical protein
LLDSHTIFAGVTYSDAHVMLPGTLVVCVALISEGGQQVTQTMEPNFVLMKLPGETGMVRGDSAVHAGQPEQSDWLDRGA